MYNNKINLAEQFEKFVNRELTAYEDWQLKKYGKVLKMDRRPNMNHEVLDYKLTGAELQAEVISEDLFTN